MTTTFPHESLGYPTLDGYAVARSPRHVRLEVADGPAVYRALPGLPADVHSVRWLWSARQYALARWWLEQYGRGWFRCQVRTTEALTAWATVHFVDEPTAALDASTGGWVVSAQLEVEATAPARIHNVVHN